jgi:hypothetical protein
MYCLSFGRCGSTVRLNYPMMQTNHLVNDAPKQRR